MRRMGTVVEERTEERTVAMPLTQPYMTTCWGCGYVVQLPKYEPEFRCGWCYAVTRDFDSSNIYHHQHHHYHHHHRHDLQSMTTSYRQLARQSETTGDSRSEQGSHYRFQDQNQQLHLQDGRGALDEMQSGNSGAHQKCSHHQHSQHSCPHRGGEQTKRGQAVQNCCGSQSYFIWRDRLLVLGVSVLVVSIIGGGVAAVFPVLFFPRPGFGFLFHSAITAFLSFNVFFNYLISCSSDAGRPLRIPFGSPQVVGHRQLFGYTFCTKCQQPKPSNAHHCRACNACVLEMDHHCPFIGNCVGLRNHRHFVLFLVYAVLGCTYVIIMCLVVFMKLWSAIVWNRREDFARRLGLRNAFRLHLPLKPLLEALFTVEPQMSMHLAALVYLVLASLGVIIGVGLLLLQQIDLMREGLTLVAAMKATTAEGSSSLQSGTAHSAGTCNQRAWSNLRRVFGNGNPLLWFLPRFSPPVGSASGYFYSKEL